MTFHLPHRDKPRRRSRHGVVTDDGRPVDREYFRRLSPAAASAPTREMPRVSPSSLPGPQVRDAAVTMRLPRAPRPKPSVPVTARGVRIVSSFFDDPDFARPLEQFMADVHRKSHMMARLFDRHAARIEYEHDLDTHFAAARRDGAELAARYAEGGTANMADLVTQVRARIVADALTGGAR